MDVNCDCGVTFQAKSARAKFCSDRCRKRRQRGGTVVPIAPDVTGPNDSAGPVERATAKSLEIAGRLDTPLGQTCLVLARRLDVPGVDTGSALAAVAGKLESMIGAATRGAAKQTAPQQLADELAERRAKHGV